MDEFTLKREPARKAAEVKFENNDRSKQLTLFSTGRGELRGQRLMFEEEQESDRR